MILKGKLVYIKQLRRCFQALRQELKLINKWKSLKEEKELFGMSIATTTRDKKQPGML